MERSIYLAKLIGPVLVVISLGPLINALAYRAMAMEFLHSPALIFISGMFALVAGIAIVLAHNVWDSSWRVIISVLGWLGIAGGLFRIMAPHQVETIGTAIISRSVYPIAGGLIMLLVGAVLSYFGYVDAATAHPRRTSRRRRR